jgi:hypothetical protein
MRVRRATDLTTSATDRFAGAGLVVHRATGFTMAAPDTLVRKGLPVTGLERSIVDSWPVIPAEHRRQPVIDAVAGRLTQPKRLRAVLDNRPRLADRATLTRVLQLLEIGCPSALEMWGYEHVFAAPGMPEFRRQVPVRIGSRTVYLDGFAEDELVNFDSTAATGTPPRPTASATSNAMPHSPPWASWSSGSPLTG